MCQEKHANDGPADLLGASFSDLYYHQLVTSMKSLRACGIEKGTPLLVSYQWPGLSWILMAAIRKQDKQTSRSVPIMVQAQSRKTGCLRRRVTPNVTSCLRNGTILVFISENSTGSAPLGQLKITGLFRAYSIYKRIQDGYFPQEKRGNFVTQHTNICFFRYCKPL